MIPKVIHYCWFGKNPLPILAQKCIESWKKYLPEYEIKEWNESNFDVNCIPYVKEAYEAKKYAFVSDYARFWILYHYGGIYFDTDVEIIKSMDDILSKGSFMACEEPNPNNPPLYPPVNAGLGLAVNAHHEVCKKILMHYEHTHFKLIDGTYNQTTVVKVVTDILIELGLKNTSQIQKCHEIYIYPKDYFCPKSYYDKKIRITSNTVAIHHFDGSWLSKKQKIKMKIKKLLGLQ